MSQELTSILDAAPFFLMSHEEPEQYSQNKVDKSQQLVFRDTSIEDRIITRHQVSLSLFYCFSPLPSLEAPDMSYFWPLSAKWVEKVQ